MQLSNSHQDMAATPVSNNADIAVSRKAQSISTHFTWSLITVLTLLLVGLAAFNIWNDARKSEITLENTLSKAVGLAQTSLPTPLRNAQRVALESFAQGLLINDAFAYVKISIPSAPWGVTQTRPEYKGKDYAYFVGSSRYLVKSAPILYGQTEIGRIQLAIAQKSLKDKIFADALDLLPLILLVITAVSLTSLRNTRKYVSQPLRQLEKSALQIAKGDLTTPIELAETVEIGNFGTVLTTMRQALRKAFSELQQSKEQLESHSLILEQKVQSSTADLRRALDSVRALNEVGRTISGTLDLQKVARTIVAHAVHIGKADAGAIFDFYMPTKTFFIGESYRLEDGLITVYKANPIPMGWGIAGGAAGQRSVTEVRNIQSGQDYMARAVRSVLLRHGYRSILSIPLLRQDIMIGALSLFRRQTGSFGEEVISELQSFASQSGLAIENARLFREIRDKNQRLEDAGRHKSYFIANMSHELRTPLNAIIGYSEMLQEEAEDLGEKSFVADLQKIQGAGKHLLSLINNILDLSKIEAGKMDLYLEEVEINQMLQEVVSTITPLIEKNHNTFEFNPGPGLGRMNTDVTKIRQVLFNLLSNAAKFAENGKVTLAVEREHIGSQDWIAIHVSDTGIGMTEEQCSKLFQAFTQADASTTRKYGGTGLGLAISQRFCQMMGGNIAVTSALGKGTTFTARVPTEATQAAATPLLASDEVVADDSSELEGQPTILVIDDDPTVHDLMRRFLTKESLRMRSAMNGETGLKLARELRPDLITLDVLMPGLDGWAVLTALKADPELSDIPVIMLSIEDEINVGYSLGAADFMTKPVDWERFSALLVKHQSNGTTSTALIVEDDFNLRGLLRRQLEKSYWEVAEASNGRDALLSLTEQLPQLIILDLLMPEMNGFEFLAEIRTHELWRNIPVMVVTAKDLSVEDRERLGGKVTRILQKAVYSQEDLMQEVRNLARASLRSKKFSEGIIDGENSPG
jgi:signal transduction histidine kinase/DNA-binding response OmpR family regulator/HAMP domain-containing protein